MTLVELVIAISITSMLSVVLGGLMMAVHTAREHGEGLAAATTQATAAIDRIHYMVSQAGVYQVSGQPTTAGLAVVNHSQGSTQLPDVLVVWSGGREGGMAANGTLNRLPRVDELVIYSPDPDDPSRLVEITVPGNSSEIEFRDASFGVDILNLIVTAGTERVLLSDRIRHSSPAESANIRFVLEQTPEDSALAAAAPGTPEWYELSWAQGIVSSDSGLRQANIRMEFQVNRREQESAGTEITTDAIPYFGSASLRYVYNP